MHLSFTFWAHLWEEKTFKIQKLQTTQQWLGENEKADLKIYHFIFLFQILELSPCCRDQVIC